ncbi:MAG: ATPase inhibitor subunit zeta [Pseudomonadota bacterium]
MGQWAAKVLSRSKPETYIKEVIKSGLEKDRGEDIFRKLSVDLGIKVSAEYLHTKMAVCLAQEKSEIMKDM